MTDDEIKDLDAQWDAHRHALALRYGEPVAEVLTDLRRTLHDAVCLILHGSPRDIPALIDLIGKADSRLQDLDPDCDDDGNPLPPGADLVEA